MTARTSPTKQTKKRVEDAGDEAEKSVEDAAGEADQEKGVKEAADEADQERGVDDAADGRKRMEAPRSEAVRYIMVHRGFIARR